MINQEKLAENATKTVLRIYFPLPCYGCAKVSSFSTSAKLSHYKIFCEACATKLDTNAKNATKVSTTLAQNATKREPNPDPELEKIYQDAHELNMKIQNMSRD